MSEYSSSDACWSAQDEQRQVEAGRRLPASVSTRGGAKKNPPSPPPFLLPCQAKYLFVLSTRRANLSGRALLPIAYVCSGRSVTCDIGFQTFGQNGQFAVIPDFSEYSGQQFLEADGSGVLVGHRRVALRLNVAGPGYLRMSHKEEQKLWSVTFMSSLSS